MRIAILDRERSAGISAPNWPGPARTSRSSRAGAHLEAIRARGPGREERRLGDFIVRAPRGRATPRAVGPVDVVIVAVKAYDNATAMPMLAPLIGPDTVVLTLQNGVDSVDEVAAVVGGPRVLGGTTYVATALEAPGLIVQTGVHRSIIFGEVFGDARRDLAARAGDRRRAGARRHPGHAPCPTRACPSGTSSCIWRVLPVSPARARLPIGPLWKHAARAGDVLRCSREVAAIAAAEGVTISANRFDTLKEYMDNIPPATRSSLLIDLEQGKRIEVEALQGAAVRRAAEHRRAGARSRPTLYACSSRGRGDGRRLAPGCLSRGSSRARRPAVSMTRRWMRHPRPYSTSAASLGILKRPRQRPATSWRFGSCPRRVVTAWAQAASGTGPRGRRGDGGGPGGAARARRGRAAARLSAAPRRPRAGAAARRGLAARRPAAARRAPVAAAVRFGWAPRLRLGDGGCRRERRVAHRVAPWSALLRGRGGTPRPLSPAGADRRRRGRRDRRQRGGAAAPRVGSGRGAGGPPRWPGRRRRSIVRVARPRSSPAVPSRPDTEDRPIRPEKSAGIPPSPDRRCPTRRWLDVAVVRTLRCHARGLRELASNWRARAASIAARAA